MIKEITPIQLSKILSNENERRTYYIADIRSAEEFSLASIAHTQSISMQDLQSVTKGLDKNRKILCICHHGFRSIIAVRELEKQGFLRLYSLAGGIQRWSEDVDPSVPTY